MGNFQVCDVFIILFKLEKPHIKHLEGFILLPREGGELQNVLRTINRELQLKNSKEFPHWISKSWCIIGGRIVYAISTKLFKRKVYSSKYQIWIIGHIPMMCNGNLYCNLRGGGNGCGIS